MTDAEILEMTIAITKPVTIDDINNLATATAAHEAEAARVTIELLKFFKKKREETQ